MQWKLARHPEILIPQQESVRFQFSSSQLVMETVQTLHVFWTTRTHACGIVGRVGTSSIPGWRGKGWGSSAGRGRGRTRRGNAIKRGIRRKEITAGWPTWVCVSHTRITVSQRDFVGSEAKYYPSTVYRVLLQRTSLR